MNYSEFKTIWSLLVVFYLIYCFGKIIRDRMCSEHLKIHIENATKKYNLDVLKVENISKKVGNSKFDLLEQDIKYTFVRPIIEVYSVPKKVTLQRKDKSLIERFVSIDFKAIHSSKVKRVRFSPELDDI